MQYILFPKFLCPTRARFRAAVASLTYQTFHSIPTRSLPLPLPRSPVRRSFLLCTSELDGGCRPRKGPRP